MGCIVQMCKYAILPFEDIVIFSERLHIVWIPIDCIWSCQITNLCYTQLHIANLFVKKTRLHFVRIRIWLAGNYIVMDAAAIVQSLAHHLLGAHCCRSARGQLAPLALRHFLLCSITRGSLNASCRSRHALRLPRASPVLSSIILLELFVWHPMDSALMILSVSGLGHHHVVYLLLGSCGSGWIIRNVISLISWRFPGYYGLSI